MSSGACVGKGTANRTRARLSKDGTTLSLAGAPGLKLTHWIINNWHNVHTRGSSSQPLVHTITPHSYTVPLTSSEAMHMELFLFTNVFQNILNEPPFLCEVAISTVKTPSPAPPNRQSSLSSRRTAPETGFCPPPQVNQYREDCLSGWTSTPSEAIPTLRIAPEADAAAAVIAACLLDL